MINLNDQWDRMVRLTELFLTQGEGTTELSEQYTALLKDCEPDRMINGKLVLGMKRAPASRHRHHDFEGGLVAHLLQMWDLWIGMRNVFQAHADVPSVFDHQNVWRAILHHDLNKVWKYELLSADPWMVDNATDELTALLTDTHKSIYLLGRQNITLSRVLHAALITAEGGFSAVRPRIEPVFSKVLYLLDDMSANVVDRLQRDRFWDSKAGGVREIP